MRKKLISVLIACALVLMSLPCYAKSINTEMISYTFTDDLNVDSVFTGTAVGSGAWTNDSLTDFLQFENSQLTVSSQRKAAFVSLDNSMKSDCFDMTADISVSIENGRTTDAYATGFAFAADDNGYYKVLFTAANKVVIAKTDTLYTASQGKTLVTAPLNDSMKLDKTTQAVKISLNKQKISVYSNDVLLAEYDSQEEIEKGFFGFITSRDMSAVYNNFKITMYEDHITYDESDYEIPEFTAVNENSLAVLTWKNPDVNNITSARILNEAREEISGYKEAISLKANAENRVTVDNLPHNTDVGLMVELTFADHAAKQSEIRYINIPYTDSDYKITGFSAEAQTSGAVLKWNNPAAEGIKSITVTDDKGNVYTKNISLAGGALNKVTVSGLTGGEIYTFTVTVKYEDGRTDSASGSITAIVLEESGYHPQNVLVYESYTRLGISWKNPEKNISGIKVLDYKTGAPAEFDDVITLASGAANNVLIKDLSSKETSEYRIIFSFPDGHENVEYVAGGLAYGKGSYYDYEQNTSTKISGWDVFFNVATASYGSLPAYIAVDRNEKYSGNSSARFAASYAKIYGNIFYQLRINPLNEYNPEYTYRISMKVKYVNAKDSVILVYANKPMNCYADGTKDPRYSVGTNLTPKVSSDGWETVSLIMEPKTDAGIPRESGKEFAVRILNTAEAFWIDDMEMVPVDSSGNVIGANILPNGGLEAEDNTPCGNVKANAENSSLKNGTAELCWENPDDSQLKNILIYREIGGELYECANLSGQTNSIKLQNIPTDAENVRFVIKTADSSDNISSGTVIELQQQLDECLFGKINFESGGKNLTEIPDGFEGTVTASVSVTNNALNDFSGVIAVAAYKGDMLQAVSVSPSVWFRKGAGETVAKTSISVSAQTGWTLKAFLLDDIVNMKLLTDKSEI